MLAGVAMLIGKEPLSLLQYSALVQAGVAGKDRHRTLFRLRRIIVVGSILFLILGLYLALNPFLG
jgi:hypothetical protein